MESLFCLGNLQRTPKTQNLKRGGLQIGGLQRGTPNVSTWDSKSSKSHTEESHRAPWALEAQVLGQRLLTGVPPAQLEACSWISLQRIFEFPMFCMDKDLPTWVMNPSIGMCRQHCEGSCYAIYGFLTMAHVFSVRILGITFLFVISTKRIYGKKGAYN